MSHLHDKIIKKYGSYSLTFRAIKLNKNHYLFKLIANGKIIITGTAIPLLTFDLKKNSIFWSDGSNALDKKVIRDVRDIRKRISSEISFASKDYSVMTLDEMKKSIKSISKIIDREILIDECHSPNLFLIYCVNEILN